MGSMFKGCTSLISIPEMNTSNVTDMSSMFKGCKNISMKSKVLNKNLFKDELGPIINIKNIEKLTDEQIYAISVYF